MNGTLKGQYAGFVSRLIAYGIDLAIVAISLIAMAWLINTTASIFHIEGFITTQSIQILLAGLGALLFSAAYHIFFWSVTGQTIGKMVMGLRVTTIDGQTLSLVRATIRFAGYLISLMALYLGFLWILIDNRRQGWHDKLAGSIVVYAWDAEPSHLYLENTQEREQYGAEEG